MNRLVAEGLMIEALKQRLVVVLSANQMQAYGSFYEAERIIRPIYPDAQYRRSNGQERISFEYGGAIWFRSAYATRSLEGLRADVVYLDVDRRELHDLYESRHWQTIQRMRHMADGQAELIVRD